MLSIEETEAPDLKIQRAKKITVSCAGETAEFQEDRNLFAHMIVIRKSRREIHTQEAVVKYKCTVVPRSILAADGTMLHCLAKSALMYTLLAKKKSVPKKE